jgi:hypothetical protein
LADGRQPGDRRKQEMMTERAKMLRKEYLELHSDIELERLKKKTVNVQKRYKSAPIKEHYQEQIDLIDLIAKERIGA